MSRIARAALTATLLSLLALTPAHAAPGDLDTSYGSAGGRALNPLVAGADKALVTPTGTYVAGATASHFWVAKFTPSGQIDTAFGGGNGIVPTQDVGNGQKVSSLALTDDGLVVAGTAVEGGRRKIVVTWVDPADGDHGGTNDIEYLDPAGTAFEVGGVAAAGTRLIVVGNSASGSKGVIGRIDSRVAVSAQEFTVSGYTDIALQSIAATDGGFTAAGYAYDTVQRLLLVQIAPDGTRGATTGYTVGEGNVSAPAIAASGTGAYVALDAVSGGRDVHGVAKVAGGALDETFGSAGVALAALPVGHAQSGAVAVDGDRVYVAGGRESSATWTVARFSSAGAVDTGFGTNGVASIAMGEGTPSMARAVRVADGKATLAGYMVDGGQVRPAAARIDAGASTTPPPATDTGTPTQNTSTTSPVTPVTPAGPATLAVRGLTLTVVASTEKRVNVLNLKGWHFTSATEILRDFVPYLELDWSFSSSGCGKDVQDGTIVERTGDVGEMVVSPERPARVSWKVCLQTQELAKFCSAKKIGGVIKKGTQNMQVFEEVLGAMGKCKIDYDIKLTKQADTPDLTKLRNTPAPAAQKRKPIEAAIECSSHPDSQQINAVWGEGVAVGASYGFHEPAPGIGYAIPAGQPSFVRLNVTTKTSPMLPLEARVFVDGDETGMLKMEPRSFKGEVILRLTPQRPGTIRACVVYEASNGVATATAAIQVVAEPKVGTVWRTAAGRQIEMTKNGPRVLAGFGGTKARAAWSFGDLWNGIAALFRGTPQVTQIAATPQSPDKKAAAARGAGYSVGQLGTGGRLGTQPGLPIAERGTLLTSQNGQLGSTSGTLLKQNPGGTLIGQAGGNVVSAGSMNGQGGTASTVGAQVVPPKALSLISDNGLGLLSDNGLGIIGSAGGNLLGTAAGNIIGSAAGNLIGAAGGNVVAAGGLN